MMKALHVSLVTVATVCGCSSTNGTETTPPAAPHVVPQSLNAAHKAYLEGDFLTLGERLHDVLLDSSSNDLVKQNAYELLEKAFQTNKGTLPSKFELPPGYRSLHLGYFHVDTPVGSHYEIHTRILGKDTSHITGFSLRRLPDELLLDKKSGKGGSMVRRDPAATAAGVEELILNSGPIDAPPADGVVSIRLELDDGTATEGYVITHNLASSSTPEIRVPESTSDSQPVIAWQPFVTPEYASHEGRAIVIHVSPRQGGPMAWEYFTKKPDAPAEVRIGTGGWPAGVHLAAGDYWASVSAGEERFFGPVTLVRLSRTTRPLRVVQ
jgi:hypothetical protein